MKIKFTFWQVLVFLCVLCCVGCSKFDEELTPNVTDEISGRIMTRSGVVEGEELVILGEKLVNPFTVENMQAAYNILKAGAQEIGTVNISKPTHIY